MGRYYLCHSSSCIVVVYEPISTVSFKFMHCRDLWADIIHVTEVPAWSWFHYNDVIMGPIASQITGLTIVYSTVYSDADQRNHQSSASLAFVRGIYRGPMNSPYKWSVTRKMFPFDDVIMFIGRYYPCYSCSRLNMVYWPKLSLLFRVPSTVGQWDIKSFSEKNTHQV